MVESHKGISELTNLLTVTEELMSDAEVVNEIQWDAFGDGAATLERSRVEGGEPWAACSVAGLQFYDYSCSDGLDGTVVPKPGDRLPLVRRPDNPADRNACEVWWRNEHRLGHLPREIAAAVATRIDDGEPLRAYVLDSGDGSAWSMRVLLVGRACESLHGRRLEAARSTWGERRTASQLERIPPSERKQGALAAWAARLESTRARRRADALKVFGHMAAAEVPGAEQKPDEAMRGTSFHRWMDVPPWLRTRKQLGKLGFKLCADAWPFALKTGGYGPYELYLVRDAVPLRARVQNVASSDSRDRRRDGT